MKHWKKMLGLAALLFVLTGLFWFGLDTSLASRRIVEVNNVAKEYQSEKSVLSETKNVKNDGTIHLLFGGDMMFDRYIREIGEKRGYDFVFATMTEQLRTYDMVIANLEGPITSQPSKSVGSEFGSPSNYIFTFDPKVAGVLWENNIRMVSLANNHSLNFGRSGLEETRSILAQEGVRYFGTLSDESQRSARENFDGVEVTFVGYNQFASDAREEKEKTLDAVRKARLQGDAVIVFAHWGEEYGSSPSDSVRALAHEMIDAGADMIVGAHPHVAWENETYKEKPIYYSMGNFVFDQFFREDTQRGLLVEASIDRKSRMIVTREIPIRLGKNGQVTF